MGALERARGAMNDAKNAEGAPSVELGEEWLVDAHGCDVAALRSVERVRGVLEHVMTSMALTPVGAPQVHQFGGEAGITALVLLCESHLAIHTFPEHAAATLNLYCCRARPAFEWSPALARYLGSTRLIVRHVKRGGTR